MSVILVSVLAATSHCINSSQGDLL